MTDMPNRIFATSDFKWVRVPIGWDVMPERPTEYIHADEHRRIVEQVYHAAYKQGWNRVMDPPDGQIDKPYTAQSKGKDSSVTLRMTDESKAQLAKAKDGDVVPVVYIYTIEEV